MGVLMANQSSRKRDHTFSNKYVVIMRSKEIKMHIVTLKAIIALSRRTHIEIELHLIEPHQSQRFAGVNLAINRLTRHNE